jgi:hypothetical protein
VEEKKRKSIAERYSGFVNFDWRELEGRGEETRNGEGGRERIASGREEKKRNG